MQDPESVETIKAMRQRSIRMEREGEYWSPEERKQLENYFNDGMGITEIAVTIQRTELAVMQQIEKLDLYQRIANPKRQRLPKEHCGCLCSHCELFPNCCPHRKVPESERGTA